MTVDANLRTPLRMGEVEHTVVAEGGHSRGLAETPNERGSGFG